MHSMSSSIGRALLAGAVALTAALPAAAFTYYPIGSGQAAKWGSNAVGTPGGVVTWSLIPDGTGLDASVSSFGWTGTNDMASVYAQVGGAGAALAAIQAAFNAWSAVANITFVQVTETGSLPFGAAYGSPNVVGNIRIGAYAFASGDFTGAVGFTPPPNGGTTLEGDVIFNVNNRFGIPAGAEGDLYDLYPPPTGFYLNDFAGLMTHEIGHALGLGHSDVPTAVMCGYLSPSFDGSQCYWADPDGDGKAPITRMPKADDIAGVQFLYGAQPIPEPGAAALWLAGLAAVAGVVRRRRSG
jgi:hypothetical protein